MTAASLETFLPAPDTSFTLEDLLSGFGKWWQAQPSRTDYPRHYDTDAERYLVVWEGTARFYDPYGDFAEDNTFFNYAAKGYMIFFHLSLKPPHGLEVKISKGYEDIYRGVYSTLAEVRAGMIADWSRIEPTLGSQGEALRSFMADNVWRVVALLQRYGNQWAYAIAPHPRHSLVYQADRQIYLCLWEGEEEAVHPRLTPDLRLDLKMQTRPRIEWSCVQSYAEMRVSFMRLPVRLEVHRRMWDRKPGSHSGYANITGQETMRTFAELTQIPLLARMRFYDPDGPIEDIP